MPPASSGNADWEGGGGNKHGKDVLALCGNVDELENDVLKASFVVLSLQSQMRDSESESESQ